MVLFRDQQLKNQLEEAREERDFFQTKYQEQMAELTAMRKALQASQREISRLRKEIIVGSPLSNKARAHHTEDEEKKEEDESFDENDSRLVRIQSVTSGITEASDVDEEHDLDENAAIRESASKLLQWVDHRVSSQQIQQL